MTKPISKSKRQLAQLLIEAGVTQFPEGANWAAQDKSGMDIYCYKNKPRRPLGWESWHHDGCVVESGEFQADTLTPNWHQTVLSRDEFDQIVATEKLPEHVNCRCVVRSIPEPTTTPTLDQLLQDWRNADDYAQRRQTEADQAAAMRDERWQAVQARAGEMGVTVGRCEPVVDVEPDDGWIEWYGGECPVPKGTFVDIRIRDGREELNLAADTLTSGRNPDASCAFWQHDDVRGDIVAYRLARP